MNAGTIVVIIVAIAGVVGIGILVARYSRKLRYCRLKLLAELSEEQEYDLLELWEHRFVLPKGTGQTITHVNAEIENRTYKRLRVLITPGTYFVSST